MVVDGDGYAPGLDLVGLISFKGSANRATGRLFIDETATCFLEILADSFSESLAGLNDAIQSGLPMAELGFMHAGGQLSLFDVRVTNINWKFSQTASKAICRVSYLVENHDSSSLATSAFAVTVRVPELVEILSPLATFDDVQHDSANLVTDRTAHTWSFNGLAFRIAVATHLHIKGDKAQLQNWTTMSVTSATTQSVRHLTEKLIEVLMLFQILEMRQYHFDNMRVIFAATDSSALTEANVFFSGYDIYQSQSTKVTKSRVPQPSSLINQDVLEAWCSSFEAWQKAIFVINSLATSGFVTAEERTINSFIAIELAGLLLGPQHDGDAGPNRQGRLQANVCAERCMRFAYPSGPLLGSSFSVLADRMATNVNDIKHPRLVGFPDSEESYVIGCVAQAIAKKSLLRKVMPAFVDMVSFPERDWALTAARHFGLIFE